MCVRFYVCLLEGRGRRKGHFLTSPSQFSRKGKLRSVKYGNEIHYYDNCSNQDSMCKACMQMCSCCSFYLKVHLAFIYLFIMGSKKAKEGKNIKSGIRSCLRISTKSRLWLSEKWIILFLNPSFCFDHKGKAQVMHCCPHMALCCYHFKSIVFWNVARPADPDVPKQSQTMFPPTCVTVRRFRYFFKFIYNFSIFAKEFIYCCHIYIEICPLLSDLWVLFVSFHSHHFNLVHFLLWRQRL